MGRIVNRLTSGDRRPTHGLQLAGLVAGLVGLAVAGGERQEETIGVATALVWILVLVLLAGPADRARECFGRITGLHLIATLLLAGLLGLTALSLSWSADDGAGFAECVLLAGYLGAFLLVGLAVGPGRGRSLCAAVGIAVVAVAAVALSSRLLGLWGGDEALAELLPPASGRLSYPIGYWNALGALMALGLPVLVSMAARADRPVAVGLWTAAAAPTLLTAYMTSSRGALLAGLIGVGVVIGLARDRPRAAATLVVAVAGALPAAVAATVADGILSEPGAGAPGTAELVVIGALLAGAGAALALAHPLIDRLAAIRIRSRFRPPRLVAVAVVAAVAVGLVLLTGPGRLVDNFSALPDEARTDAATGILSASGSGRAQFWGVALDAFADDPLRGTGAGGFAAYWNRNGSLGTPARNAHSEPLELLAEVGILGFACFLGFAATVAVAGVRRARSPAGRSDAGMALGLLAAGSVGYLIDWTWQVPAVTAPVLVVAAGLAGSAFSPAPARARSPAPERRASPIALPPQAALLSGVVVLVALASIWAAGVHGIASAKLRESRQALADGEPNAAAQSAREAAQVVPWDAEPWLRLAEVELAVDNLAAARLATRAALERAPEDFRVWLLASVVEAELGNGDVAIAFAVRAATLAPRLLERIPEFARPQGREGA